MTFFSCIWICCSLLQVRIQFWLPLMTAKKTEVVLNNLSDFAWEKTTALYWEILSTASLLALSNYWHRNLTYEILFRFEQKVGRRVGRWNKAVHILQKWIRFLQQWLNSLSFQKHGDFDSIIFFPYFQRWTYLTQKSWQNLIFTHLKFHSL